MSCTTEATLGAPDTDAELIARSATSPEEFGKLFDRHGANILRYIRRRVGVPPADDLLAETFLTAFEQRQRYDLAIADARPWLFGIATNLLRRHARSEARAYRALARTGTGPTGPSMDDRIAERLDAQAAYRPVAAALAGLSRTERDTLLLFAWGELSYEEIARALDIPIGTVRSRLHRARARLQAALAGASTTSHTTHQENP